MTEPQINHIVLDKKRTARFRCPPLTWMVLIISLAGCTAALMTKEPLPPVVGKPVIAGNLENVKILRFQVFEIFLQLLVVNL